jgi:hypothetical protein
MACVLLLFSTASIAQCGKDVLFYKGLFHAINFDKDYNYLSISETGYPSFDSLTKSNIDSLSLKDTYSFSRYPNDSIVICSGYIQRFSNGSKWAVFNRGVKLTDFKYDYAYPLLAPRPFPAYDKHYTLVKIGKDWGVLDESGKELTAVKYHLPELNEKYHSEDSIICTAHPITVKMNTSNPWGTNYRCFGYSFLTTNVLLVKEGKIGIVDSMGNQVVPFIYDSLFCSSYKCLIGSRGGKRYYITSKGMELNVYDAVEPIWRFEDDNPDRKFFSGIYMVKKKGKWGIVNSVNNQRTRCVFDFEPGRESFSFCCDYYTRVLMSKRESFLFEVFKDRFVLKAEGGKDVIPDFIEK